MLAGGARDALAAWKQKIDLFLHSNHLDGAVNAIEQMIQQNISVPPAVLADVLKSFAKRGDANTAVRLLEKCEQGGTRPNASCFSAVIWAHRKKRPPDPQGALAFLDQMENKRFSPNCATYNQVIGAYCDASEPEQGVTILNRMHECTVQPDIFNFGCIVQAYGNRGDIDNAKKLFERAASMRLQPDAVCYQSIIGALAKAGDLDSVKIWEQRARAQNVPIGCGKEKEKEETFQAPGSSSNEKMFIPSSSSLSHAGASISGSATRRQKVSSSGASGSTGRSVQMFDEQIAKAVERQDANAACRHLLQMCSSSCTMPAPALLASVLKLIARRGDINACFRLVEACKRVGTRPNAACYTALILAHRRSKPPDATGALRVLDEMASKGFKANCSTYNSVICAFAERDDAMAAESILEKMIHAGVNPDLFNYSAVINAHAKQGDSVAAGRIFEDALQQNLVPDLVCFNAVADSFSKQADPSGAAVWLERAQESNLKPDIVSYNIVLSAFANNLDPKGAVSFFHKMLATTDLNVSTISYNSVIAAYAQVGDILNAARWLGRMAHKNIRPTSVSYSSVITACAKSGNERMCLHFMRKLLRSGVPISEASVFNALLGVFCILDRPDVGKFMYWFNKMFEHGLEPDSISYNLLINLHARAGQPDVAANYLEHMITKNLDPGVRCFSAVLDAFGKQKDDKMVMHWAQRMKEFGTRPNNITFNGAVERHKYCETFEHEHENQSC